MKPKKIINIVVFVAIIAFMYGSVNNSSILSDSKNAYLGGIQFYSSGGTGYENTFGAAADASGYEVALAQAKAENKPVMVYFWAVWCQYCEKFETGTMTDPRVKSMMENDFILISVDLDEDSAISQKWGVSYPPNELFITAEGNEITRTPGYVDANSFTATLQGVKSQYNGKGANN